MSPKKITLSRRFLVMAATAIVVTACDDRGDSGPMSPSIPLARRIANLRSLNPAREIVTPDDLNDSIANHVPGFGGFYVDEAQRLVIWSKDPGRGQEIRGLIEAFVKRSELGTLPLMVRQATYDVRDLRRWRRGLEEALAGVDWRAADVDERTNQVYFGVGSAAAGQELTDVARRLGIPASALAIQVITTRLMQTPDNYSIQTGVRPLPGGVSIGLNQYSLGVCTFGFLVKLDTTSSDTYGVTASHCTARLDTNDHTKFWQYEDSTFNEWYEAPFTSTLSHGIGPNPCPSGKTCRYADAVLMKVPANFTNLGFGNIVATIDSTHYYSGGGASRLVDQSVSPYRKYSIYTETTMGSFYVGDVIHKVGISSGHTYGPVVHSCIDLVPGNGGSGGSRFGSLYVCQMVADAYVYPGDSGSPVFNNVNGFTILEGIVWEQFTDVDGHLYLGFSPIDGVHFDLGPFVAYPGGSLY